MTGTIPSFEVSGGLTKFDFNLGLFTGKIPENLFTDVVFICG